jgi:hypothetical protein
MVMLSLRPQMSRSAVIRVTSATASALAPDVRLERKERL